MTIGEIIEEYRRETGLSAMDFAKKAGLSKAYIYILQNNRRANGEPPGMPGYDVIVKLAKAMGMTPNELTERMEGKTKNVGKAQTQSIPVLGRVAAGQPIHAEDNIIGLIDVPERFARSGDVFGLKIKGNSMYPEIKDGDIVVVRKQDFFEDKNICIVRINGEDATCKRVIVEKGGLWLIPINPEYERKFYTKEEVETLPVEIVGKVFEVRRSYA